MEKVKQINIKNRSYCFRGDVINIENFHLNLLTTDKKLYKEIDINNIDYIVIKKFNYCENIHSVNPLYLIIHSAARHLKNNEENT